MVAQSPGRPACVCFCVCFPLRFLPLRPVVIVYGSWVPSDIRPGSASALEPPHLRLIRCPAASNRPPSWAELLNGVVRQQSALEYWTKPGSSSSIVSSGKCAPARREAYCLLCLFPLGTGTEWISWRWITSRVFLERGQKRTTMHYRGPRRRALWIAYTLNC